MEGTRRKGDWKKSQNPMHRQQWRVLSRNFTSYLAEHGIKCEITNAYTPQESVSECANQTISTLTHSMIADTKEVLQAKSLPLSLWPQAIQHAVWIKNRIPSQSLNRDTTPYQEYFGKKPSLATLHLFGCKAYAHIPKVDQTKLSERTIECIHVGFVEEKRAYLLWNRERRRLIESWDVKFEEGDGEERVTVDSDSEDEGSVEPNNNTESGDPEGGHKPVDHQENLRTSGDDERDIPSSPTESPAPTSSYPNPPTTHTPTSQSPNPPTITPTIRRSTCANKGVPPTHPDKDPKLQLGSRPPTKKPSMPAVQQDTPTSGGTSADTTNTGGTLPDGDKDGGALFLTVDAPRSYREAMG